MQLETITGRVIRMTPWHLLPAGACDVNIALNYQEAPVMPGQLKYARDVVIGDCIYTTHGVEQVVRIIHTTAEGIHTVVTKEEFIVVNGVVASPFAISHTFVNIYYNLFRIVMFRRQLFIRVVLGKKLLYSL
jgi:Hint module